MINRFFEILDKHDRNFLHINISGNSEFKSQASSDFDKVASSAFGALMLAYLDVSKSQINVREAGSILKYFNKSLAVTSTVTTSRPDGIRITYSQLNGVQLDDVSTYSFITLAHELMHAVDYTQLNSRRSFVWKVDKSKPFDDEIPEGRKYFEGRAVTAENIVAQQLGIRYIRGLYSGEPVYAK